METIGFDRFQLYFENVSYPVSPARSQEMTAQLIKAVELDNKGVLDVLEKFSLPEYIFWHNALDSLSNYGEDNMSMPSWIAEENRILIRAWDRLEGLLNQVIDKQLAAHNEFFLLIDKKDKRWLKSKDYSNRGIIALYSDVFRDQLEQNYIFREMNSIEQIKKAIRYSGVKSIIFPDGKNIKYSLPLTEGMEEDMD